MKPLLLGLIAFLLFIMLTVACERRVNSPPGKELTGEESAQGPLLQAKTAQHVCISGVEKLRPAAPGSSTDVDHHSPGAKPTHPDPQPQTTPKPKNDELVGKPNVRGTGSDHDGVQTYPTPLSAPMDVTEAIQRFRASPHGVSMEAARIVRPLVKIGMTKHQVEELLGRPNRELMSGSVWHYDVFWSHAITVLFDRDGEVKDIQSTFESPTSSQSTEYAVSPPKDLADAMRQFREEQPRVAAGRMIEPLIKKGMDRKEVEELLGPPTSDRDWVWIYGLGKHEALSDYWALHFKESKLVAIDSSLRPKPGSEPQAGEPVLHQP